MATEASVNIANSFDPDCLPMRSFVLLVLLCFYLASFIMYFPYFEIFGIKKIIMFSVKFCVFPFSSGPSSLNFFCFPYCGKLETLPYVPFCQKLCPFISAHTLHVWLTGMAAGIITANPSCERSVILIAVITAVIANTTGSWCENALLNEVPSRNSPMRYLSSYFSAC